MLVDPPRGSTSGGPAPRRRGRATSLIGALLLARAALADPRARAVRYDDGRLQFIYSSAFAAQAGSYVSAEHAALLRPRDPAAGGPSAVTVLAGDARLAEPELEAA